MFIWRSIRYSPAEQTREWQPLDFRIFGSLKSRAKGLFGRMNVVKRNGNDASVNWELAVDILVRCWPDIPTQEILNAWSQIDLDVREYLSDELDEDLSELFEEKKDPTFVFQGENIEMEEIF